MSQGIISAQTLYLRYFLRFLSGALSRIVTRAGNSGFTTLENALFMDRINDVSFTIGDRLVIVIDHQL